MIGPCAFETWATAAAIVILDFRATDGSAPSSGTRASVASSPGPLMLCVSASGAVSMHRADDSGAFCPRGAAQV